MSIAPCRLVASCAAALLACGGAPTPGVEDPSPSSVDPASGFTGVATPVIIRGSGFLARTVRPASAGAPTLDARHRAWLGGAELQDVIWVDVHTLRATVPAGLPLGPQTLVVENALGRRGSLDGAYVVAGGGLAATLSPSARTVSVGQELTLTLTVKNAGNAAVAGVTPGVPAVTVTGGAAASLTGGPTPASIPSLAPGEVAAFGWTYTATGAGQLQILASVAGTDALSNGPVSGSDGAEIAVQPAAALGAALSAQPSTVGVGETVALVLTVTNTGGDGAAPATQIVPSVPVLSSANGATAALATGPSPASVTGLAAGESRTFTWTYRATAPGALDLGASATGRDANSAALLASGAPGAAVTVRNGAALAATLALPTLPVAAGADFTVAMTVANAGGAAANAVAPTALTPAPGNTGAATLVSGPTPASADIPGGNGTATFSWTYRNVAAGTFQLGGGAAGADAATGLAVTAAPVTSNVAVLAP